MLAVSVRGPALTRASAPAFSRLRLGAYICAGVLHLGAIGALALLPPETLDRFVSTRTGVEIRFFTISASDAESDLPLNAPLLADRGDTRAEIAGVEAGQSDMSGDTLSGTGESEEAEAGADVEPEPDLSPQPVAEPEAGDADEPDAPVSETGTVEADTDAGAAPPPPAPSTPAHRPGGRPFSVTSPDAPVETIQPSEEEAAIVFRRVPTFADIAERADTGLRVEDFRVGRVEGGVRAVIAEVFCLSSGDTNRDIGNCGDEPNAAQAELALYHIRTMSSTPLEFEENMSRMEFELAQLGVSPSTLELLRVHFLNAQREQTSRSPLLRAMDRERASRTDHLGISPPITPQRARDPSGER